MSSCALAVLAVSAGPAFAAPDDVTIQGENMSVASGSGANAGDSNATGGWGKHVWANATVSGTVTTTRSSVHMFVRIKPHPCLEAPRIKVRIGGKTWFEGPVNGGESLQYIGRMISLPPGTHGVEVELTNAYQQWVGPQKICSRAIFLDEVTLVATPFSADGWRNKPLPANAPIASNSNILRDEIRDQINDHMATGGAGAWIGHDKWATPIYTVPPNQPTVTVRPEPHNAAIAEQWSAVPLPPDARPQVANEGQESDRILVVWQPSTDTIWEFIGLRKDAVGNWVGYRGGKIPNASQNSGRFENPSLGLGAEYAPSASTISYLAGVQRLEEVRRAAQGDVNAIDHAIGFVVMTPRGRGGWCWPAQRTDSYATRLDPESIPAGMRFRFPASLDLSQYNLHPHARAIAEAIKRYGMIATDQGGNFGFGAEDPFQTGTNPYPGFWNNRYPHAWPSGELANFPWHELQALAPEGTGCQDKP